MAAARPNDMSKEILLDKRRSAPTPLRARAALIGLCCAALPLLQACGGGDSGDKPSNGQPAPQQNPACTQNSTLNADGTVGLRTQAYLCGTYGIATTRNDANGNPVTMDYFVSQPASGAPKALAVLIAGSVFDARITGASDGGPVATASGNFLVRSAQILANRGYQVVTLDRPTDVPSGPFVNEAANVDRYRVSVQHAIDILTVARRANTRNLDLYIFGTSRGSLSAVAANAIANGVGISSPVTRNRPDVPEQYFVGDPRVPRLLAGAVQRPILVLRNDRDECDITPPAGAVAFYDSLRTAGANATSAAANGGFKVTAGFSAADLAPCESLGFHSFMGIENAAVGEMAGWLDGRIAARGANRHPDAAFPSISTPASTPLQVNLASQASDPDGDALSFSLPYEQSNLGGGLALSGSTVIYTPPAGSAGRTDRFVYTATDSRGGVGAGVVTVVVGR